LPRPRYEGRLRKQRLIEKKKKKKWLEYLKKLQKKFLAEDTTVLESTETS